MPYTDLENEPIEIKAAKIGRNGVIFGAVLTAMLTAIFGAVLTPIIGRIYFLVDSSIKNELANNPVTLQINNAENNKAIRAIPRANDTLKNIVAAHEEISVTPTDNYEVKKRHESNTVIPSPPDNIPANNPVTLQLINAGNNIIPGIPRADDELKNIVVEHEEITATPKDNKEVKINHEVNAAKSNAQNKEIYTLEENKDYIDRTKKGNSNLNLTPVNASRKPVNRYIDPTKVVLQFKNATGIPLVLILDDVSYQGLQRVKNLDSLVTVEFPADNNFHTMTNFGQSSGSFMFKVRPVGTIIPYQLGVINIFYSEQPRLTVIKTGNKDNQFQAVIDVSE
jgi:hypothetical protein